ncbi:hypothetical protein [Baaleninema sp.]|uniref:hypothetical protein n=1 Tax=Baaleninema sp. TaxID=3101197 RepID=UPI003D07D88A
MRLAFLLWCALAVLAVTNGYIGSTWVLSQFGEAWVEPYKVVVIVTGIFAMAWIYMRQNRDRPRKAAVIAATTWVGLTILFEFVFGHYIAGDSWATLLENYRFWEGHLWILVLLSEAISPFIVVLLTPSESPT